MRIISFTKGCRSGLIPFVTDLSLTADLSLIGSFCTDFRRSLLEVFAVGFGRTAFCFVVGFKKVGSGSWHSVELSEAYSPSESSLPLSHSACKSVAALCASSAFGSSSSASSFAVFLASSLAVLAASFSAIFSDLLMVSPLLGLWRFVLRPVYLFLRCLEFYCLLICFRPF